MDVNQDNHSSGNIQFQGPLPAELAPSQPQGDASAKPAAPRRKPVKCRFFSSKKGCRAGDACRYLHDSTQKPTPPDDLVAPSQESLLAYGDSTSDSIHGVTTDVSNLSMNGSRSVPGPSPTRPTAAQRPVSKTESLNPREFQINQLRRRFRPEEKEDASGSLLTFGIAPSDPDFPFELEFLQCILHIPFSYPGDGRPTLKVTNPEMERSFQANVERGFDNIVDASLRFGGRGTLLGWMNSLDKQLERLLTTTERGPTLKFVANVPSKDTSQTVQKQLAQPQATERDIPEHRLSSNPQATPVYTAEEKAQAKKRRTTEMKQIEARLSRVPLFQKRPDEDSFVIPIQPTKPDRLPVPLRSIKKVKLLVPSLYPLEPSSIELQGIASDDARPVEMGFAQWIKENSNLNLMSQINYLASNIHNFAKTPIEEPKDLPQNAQADKNVSEELLPATKEPVAESEDRPHIHYVPRPPEWTVGNTASGSEDDDTDESDSEDFSEEDDEDGGAPVPGLPESNRERGVALSFPTLEFYGIELLELMSLSITIRCERCKEHMDVKNVPHVTDKSDGFSPRVETCKKCANSMSIGFRRQLMHPSSIRAGYLDLDGCTVVDLLPSGFIPTCSECSTTFPAPGVNAVRGESTMAICRECHRKMVFKIPEVKFLIVGTAAVSSRSALPRRKKPKETLGIVAGQELPRRGRCTHYGKSYRWFRFSCCAKVFPCDKCHDAETDHPNEHANRMICGFCSREQIYRPEACGICRATLVGKAASGFWEGGKGTRNRVLMSRKDPRKYKKRGGLKTSGTSSSKKK